MGDGDPIEPEGVEFCPPAQYEEGWLGLPHQTNGWDCGLYAVHVGFALAMQAPFSEITKARINIFRRKLVLYLLADDDTRGIMLPDYAWHERVQLQSCYFARESVWLYRQKVPKSVVDV